MKKFLTGNDECARRTYQLKVEEIEDILFGIRKGSIFIIMSTILHNRYWDFYHFFAFNFLFIIHPLMLNNWISSLSWSQIFNPARFSILIFFIQFLTYDFLRNSKYYNYMNNIQFDRIPKSFIKSVKISQSQLKTASAISHAIITAFGESHYQLTTPSFPDLILVLLSIILGGAFLETFHWISLDENFNIIPLFLIGIVIFTVLIYLQESPLHFLMLNLMVNFFLFYLLFNCGYPAFLLIFPLTTALILGVVGFFRIPTFSIQLYAAEALFVNGSVLYFGIKGWVVLFYLFIYQVLALYNVGSYNEYLTEKDLIFQPNFWVYFIGSLATVLLVVQFS
jgi:hypothetical protein